MTLLKHRHVPLLLIAAGIYVLAMTWVQWSEMDWWRRGAAGVVLIVGPAFVWHLRRLRRERLASARVAVVLCRAIPLLRWAATTTSDWKDVAAEMADEADRLLAETPTSGRG